VSAGVLGPVALDEFGDIDTNLTLLYTSQAENQVCMSREKWFNLIYERRNKMPCTNKTDENNHSRSGGVPRHAVHAGRGSWEACWRLTGLMSSGDSASAVQLVFCGTDTFLFREKG